MARKNQAEIELTARDRTQAAFRSVNTSLGRYASVGLAGAAAGVALLTRESLKLIDAQAKTAAKLGLSTQALAGLRLAAEKTGNSQRNLDLGLQRVTRRIAEAATGSGEAVKALDELGLSAVELAQKSPDEQMLDLADAFEKVDGQSNKVRLGFKLFDSEGVGLVNTLELGRDGLIASAEAADRFGTAISAVDAKSVEDANDAATDLREAIKGVGFDLARRFAPGMEAASTSAAGFVVALRRDFIPAMALLLEQMDLLVSNVRGLSDIELAIRVEVQQDKLDEISDRLTAAKKKAEKEFSSFDILGGQQSAIDAADTSKLEAEKVAAEARLAEVKSEQERRAAIILEADQALAESRAAQLEQARLAELELKRADEQEWFEERLEREQEHNAAFIKLSLKRAAEERRIRFAEAREEQRALTTQGKLEERAAQNTIRLRQATLSTSVNILQTLAGKSKNVARALFLVEKGLAIARTVQNTAAASVKVFADLPYPAAVAAAAQITAFGAAQVGLIAATAITGVGSIGGGGSPGLGGGGSFGGSDSDFGGGADFGGEQDESSGPTGAPSTGVIQLVFPSVFGFNAEVIDQIADALRDASENRDVVVVAGTGRNADLLNGANA